MRVVGVDVGARRIGLAVSDPSGTLARPLGVVTVAALDAAAVAPSAPSRSRCGPRRTASHASSSACRGASTGIPTEMTARVEAFAAALGAGVRDCPWRLQDERLSSHEAETLLADREKDWRVRKRALDAAAAAVILQDYLDARQPAPASNEDSDA